MNCGSNYAMACGADDCKRCHPENFVNGHYITNDPDEFSLGDDGTLDTVIYGPYGFETRVCLETAAEYRDSRTGELIGFEDLVRDHVLDAFADWVMEHFDDRRVSNV
jgi:hypothetical protein